VTGAVEVRESRYRRLMKNHGQFVAPELRAIDAFGHFGALISVLL
jgi:hypothetical protein